MTLRPYLIIPKLIKQPTWGGTYIPETKGWSKKAELNDIKIGQSYELFDKSNLSLLTASNDPAFTGELTDSKTVKLQTNPPNLLPLHSLIASDPVGVLGKKAVSRYGPTMPLLIKFTQALGNSFQIHLKDGISHPRWKTKPESWYYFEPGLITCGVKVDTKWGEYQKAVTDLQNTIFHIASGVGQTMSYEKAKEQIDSTVKKYNPWQYVHVVEVPSGALLDLSACGIHHSWEEDLKKIPLGNVLYEVQLNVMDDVSTIRNFDKGKIGKDGSLRPLHIEDYFALIDRSIEANTPETHMRPPQIVTKSSKYTLERLMQTRYYTTDKLSITAESDYHETIEDFRHLYVQSGQIQIEADKTMVKLTRGHSAFVPAAVHEYSIKTQSKQAIVLSTYV